MTAALGLLLAAAVKGGLLAGAARLVERGRAPAFRHLLWAAVVGAHLLLVVVAPLAPTWNLPGLVLPTSAADVLEPVAAALPGAGRAERSAPEPAATGAETVFGSGSAASAGTSVPPTGALLLIWGSVALLLLLRVLAATVAGRVGVARSSDCADPDWQRAVADAVRDLAIRRPVDVRVLADARVPMMAEIGGATLLLPPGTRCWSPERRRVVALHELAHLSRRDGVLRLLARIIRALFWFTPTVWYAVRRLEEEAEAACDHIAVGSGIAPERYVSELVGVLRDVRAGTAGAATPLGRRRGLSSRVRRLLSLERTDSPDLRPRAPLLSAGAGLIAVAALAGMQIGIVRPERPDANPFDSGASVPAGRAASASQCPYDGGLHRDVRRRAEGGSLVWEVAWDGLDCEVRFQARPGPDGWDERSPHPLGGRVEVTVAGQAATRRLRLAWQDGDAVPEVWTSGRRVNGDERRHLLAWYGKLVREIALHTGFDAPRRVPELLRIDGVQAVLSEVERTSGGHAGGSYLRELVGTRTLHTHQVQQVLAVARSKVTTDAAMAGLLADLAARYDVGASPLRSPYLRAAATLQARSAREAVLSRIQPPASGG